jgi:hypothetical protein
VWLTVDKATLKNHRNAYEYRVLVQLAEVVSADVKVMIVADRGFGDQKLYRVLTEELKFDYLIRFRGNIAVTSVEGETRSAEAWVGSGGRPRTLRNAFVTAERYQVGTVVCSRSAACSYVSHSQIGRLRRPKKRGRRPSIAYRYRSSCQAAVLHMECRHHLLANRSDGHSLARVEAKYRKCRNLLIPS